MTSSSKSNDITEISDIINIIKISDIITISDIIGITTISDISDITGIITVSDISDISDIRCMIQRIVSMGIAATCESPPLDRKPCASCRH